ncbi:hypothetical protein M1O19_00195 [Dehalococcoidia bacterium]|nr:hypothetical protein [Dehalococcoidia bacterium]MCL0079506.1 hypothetical protein [Dehalococcoidia bacterium]MCL0096950.1 hypothetical protein [Dehalococcoidia bacterium]
MSVSWSDVAYEQYIVEQEMLELCKDLKEEGVEEFRAERLQSFYLKHPEIAKPALNSLAEARNLVATSPTASLILAAITMEVGYRETLIKPMVYGLLNTEPAAALITEWVSKNIRAMDKFKAVLFHILSDYASVDLETFSRLGVQATLWQDMNTVQDRRNKVLHRGDTASSDEANHAIEVASAILETLFPMLITKLGLHLREAGEVYNDSGSREETN